ncbi:hypothetical protein P3T73_12205 [Kiritimatiellota bacterium B12222]|nr:hypothetical protein P3T73_09830 [Kiritimatiellota bacterium B12222]WFB34922.1 hypothetical protein P3T73_12205 [Kiritimatiellota bacterium B12222]
MSNNMITASTEFKNAIKECVKLKFDTKTPAVELAPARRNALDVLDLTAERLENERRKAYYEAGVQCAEKVKLLEGEAGELKAQVLKEFNDTESALAQVFSETDATAIMLKFKPLKLMNLENQAVKVGEEITSLRKESAKPFKSARNDFKGDDDSLSRIMNLTPEQLAGCYKTLVSAVDAGVIAFDVEGE